MTLREILDDADHAETFPGSNELNWDEVGFKTLAAWVESNPAQRVAVTADFDVESVKGFFQEWWRHSKFKR